jgi:hypothetical protein
MSIMYNRRVSLKHNSHILQLVLFAVSIFALQGQEGAVVATEICMLRPQGALSDCIACSGLPFTFNSEASRARLCVAISEKDITRSDLNKDLTDEAQKMSV